MFSARLVIYGKKDIAMLFHAKFKIVNIVSDQNNVRCVRRALTLFRTNAKNIPRIVM